MKRRNFFQSLVAGAAALMLPGGKDVEANHSLVDSGDLGVTGQLEVDGRVGREITWRPVGAEYYPPNSVTRASTPERIQRGKVVYLDNEGWARPIDKKDRPIFGVVDDCKKDPGGGGHLVTVIVNGKS